MAGRIRAVIWLLLFSFIRTGVGGEDGLVVVERGYDITFPCEGASVCYHVRKFSTKQNTETDDYIVIVGNGEIQIATSKPEDSKCTVNIRDLTAEDAGRHRCQQSPDVSSPHEIMPDLKVMPGQAVSVQCTLLNYIQQGLCSADPQGVILTWVDEAGAEVLEDSQYQIKQHSPCDITMKVTLQRPESKKFRCQATVEEQILTSVEFLVRVPALKGKGRGLTIEIEPENKGGNQDAIGAAVGVVGCLVLSAVVAVFVVNKRTRNQLPDEACYTTTSNVMTADDVIYADIIIPAGSDREWIQEPTEYACVRHI